MEEKTQEAGKALARLQQCNIVLIAVGSGAFLTALFTSANIIELVVSGLNQTNHTGGFHGHEGYYSVAIVFAGTGIAQLIAPLVDELIGERGILLVACVLVACNLASISFAPLVSLLYATSLLAGIGAGLFSNAQFSGVARNSPTPAKMQRNSAFVWGSGGAGFIFGNLLVFVRFRHEEAISASSRVVVYSALLGTTFVAAGLFAFVRTPKLQGDAKLSASAAAALPFRLLLRSPTMHWLLLPMLYTGFDSLYLVSVFGSSVGFTESLGADARADAGLAQIVVGLAQISVAIFCTVWPISRRRLVALGAVAMSLGLVASLLVLPWPAPLGPCKQLPLIGVASTPLVMVTAYLLGSGDALLQAMFLATVGDAFGGAEASGAYAVYWICQAVIGALGFAYATRVGLQWQLGVMLCALAVGLFGYDRVERMLLRERVSLLSK